MDKQVEGHLSGLFPDLNFFQNLQNYQILSTLITWYKSWTSRDKI